MAGKPCVECGQRQGSLLAFGGLCGPCYKEAHPTVDGVTIREHREPLKLSVNEAASALALTPKRWVDNVEDADHLPTEAARFVAALEAAAHAKMLKIEAAQQRHPAPFGAPI